MTTFKCRTWTGHDAELDASHAKEAATRFAEGAFGDYPGEWLPVWVALKTEPNVSECITVRIPDRRPSASTEVTEQEREFHAWLRSLLRNPLSLFDDETPPQIAQEVAERLIEGADFTCEVSPGVVPIELDAMYSRTGKTETFLWKLAGWREIENGPAV